VRKFLNNNPNNNKEIEDFFKEFDKISDDFNKSGSADSDSAKEEAFKEISREYTKTKRTRSARHSGKKKNTFQTVLENISIKLSALFHKGAENFVDEETQKTDMGKTTRRKKKK